MTTSKLRSLAGKRILFVGIGFYDYEAAIRSRLEDNGATVWYFLEQPRWHQSGLMRRLGSALGIRISASRARYQQRLLEQVALIDFDYVFVIKGELLSEHFVRRLKAGNRSARFILYQWDSIRRLPGIERLIPYFDRVLSFDRRDCLQRPDFAFRPLFYRNPPPSQGREPALSYDLTCIGWLHSDRLSRLLEIESELKGLGLRVYFYLYTGIGAYLRHLVLGRHRLLHFRKLSFTRVTAIMNASKCVLDLPHADQNGLTMRTIEAIGMRRKLVTTNLDISNYDFFDHENILPLEKLDAAAIAAFLEGGSRPVPEGVLRRYTLDQWLEEVFDLSSISPWPAHPH